MIDCLEKEGWGRVKQVMSELGAVWREGGSQGGREEIKKEGVYGALVEGGYFGLDCGLDESNGAGSRMEEAK